MTDRPGQSEIDPKGLIYQAYRIGGITPSQCRSIFLDWALSLPAGQDSGAAIAELLARFGPDAPDHPMSEVLHQGQAKMTNPRRRGGWRARLTPGNVRAVPVG
jgi:hypothetical protein